MTEQVINAGDSIRYKSPQVKVLGVKMHQVLCQSPGGPVKSWNETNPVDGGDMDDENGW